MDIILRDLTCTGTLTTSKDASIGHLILSAKGQGKCTVENCMFSRIFRGKDKQWKPVVSLNGNMQLSWNNNLMIALRENKKVADAVKPKKDTLRGKALEANHALEVVWAANPYDDESDFEDKLKVAAKKIIGLPTASRTQFFKAREEDLINKLPDIEVVIGHVRGVVLDRRTPSRPPSTPIPSIPSIPVRSLARNMRMVSVKPKTEVSSLYEDIKSVTADNTDKLIARLRVVAALISPIDVALALETNDVEGDISRNTIAGNVILFNEQEGAVALNWGATKNKAFKQSWSLKNSYLDEGGYLNIHDNLIYAINSRVSTKNMEELKKIVTSETDGIELQFNAYESLSVCDNVFLQLANSFIAKSLKFSGNEFRLGKKDKEVVAYALAYFDIYIGNMSMNEKSVIEHVSKNTRGDENINMLYIV